MEQTVFLEPVEPVKNEISIFSQEDTKSPGHFRNYSSTGVAYGADGAAQRLYNYFF